MAQSGYTPIVLYYSTTSGNVPTSANLTTGELALNVPDGKLFFNQSGTIVTLATANSVTSFSAGTTGLTPSSATSGAITLAGTLNVANGGTGTTTSFTTGSVVFAGASGVYSQNNAQFFWDNTNNRLGLGTASPSAKLAVVGTGYSPNIALSDASTIAWDTSTGQVATFTFVSSNRTMGAPTNLVNGGFYGLAVIQNGGNNTLTWNSVFKWTNGTAPTLSTAAGAKDYFVFRSDGTNLYEQGRSLGVA
jgi:hypothetical protein